VLEKTLFKIALILTTIINERGEY